MNQMNIRLLRVDYVQLLAAIQLRVMFSLHHFRTAEA